MAAELHRPGFLAVAEWHRGLLADAESALASSIGGWQAAGQPTVTAWGGYQLGQVQRAQGRLDAAVRTYRRALDATAPPGRPPLPAAGPAYVGLGEVAYQRNELDRAVEHVTEGIVLCRRFAYTPPLATGLVTQAWIRQATGDPAGALDAIDEAAQAAPGPPSPLNLVPAQRARLLLAQGDLAAAARWTTEHGLGADDQPDYAGNLNIWCWPGCCSPRVGRARRLELLDRLHTAAAARHRAGSLIEVGALRALALAAGGQQAAAVDALAGALTLACPHGHVRVFADEGPPMAALLRLLITAQRTGEAAAEVPLGSWSGCSRRSAQRTPRRTPGRAPPQRSQPWSSR